MLHKGQAMKTIKQLAKQFNITTTTIRHYEKMGLLDTQHVVRADNGYRIFTLAAEERIRLIQYGKAAGFSLSTLAKHIKQWEDDAYTDAEKEALFTEQLKDVEEKIKQLEATRQYLLRKLGS
jgi:DNA-binding transcriptional MerR regulator